MRQSNAYTIFFAGLVCLICSALLTLVSFGLRDRQDLNKEIERKKNVLKVIGIDDQLAKAEGEGPKAIMELYANRVKEVVIDTKGEIIEGLTPENIKSPKEELSVYVSVDGDTVTGYVIPIEGPGLWSTLYGYFSLERDLDTVKGITFYEQGETPGLGGEIEKPWFQQNFVGKKIFGEDGQLRSVTVVKGKVKEAVADEAERRYYVDGISGATMTSTSVTTLLKASLNKYSPYMATIRKGREVL